MKPSRLLVFVMVFVLVITGFSGIQAQYEPNELTFVDVSPDGEKVAAADRPDTSTLKIWDAALQTVLLEFPPVFNYSAVAWSPNSEHLAVASAADTGIIIEIFNVDDGVHTPGELLTTFDTSQSVIMSLDWHPDGVYLASGSYSGEDERSDASVSVWNVVEERLEEQRKAGLARSVAWQPGTEYFTIANHNAGVFRLSLPFPEGAIHDSLFGNGAPASDAKWHPDGAILAIATNRLALHPGQILLVDADGNEIKVIEADDISVELLGWSPDGKYIASSGMEQALKIWDYATGELLYSLDMKHETLSWAFDWSPDGQYLYYADVDLVPLRLPIAELLADD